MTRFIKATSEAASLRRLGEATAWRSAAFFGKLERKVMEYVRAGSHRSAVG